jgi:hypothetical protein
MEPQLSIRGTGIHIHTVQALVARKMRQMQLTRRQIPNRENSLLDQQVGWLSERKTKLTFKR